MRQSYLPEMLDLIQVLSKINGCSTLIDFCHTKLSFANPSHPAYLVTEAVEYFPSVLVDGVQTQVEIKIMNAGFQDKIGSFFRR